MKKLLSVIACLTLLAACGPTKMQPAGENAEPGTVTFSAFGFTNTLVPVVIGGIPCVVAMSNHGSTSIACVEKR